MAQCLLSDIRFPDKAGPGGRRLGSVIPLQSNSIATAAMFPKAFWLVLGFVVATSCARVPEMGHYTTTPTKSEDLHSTSTSAEGLESSWAPDRTSDIAQGFLPPKAEVLGGLSEGPSQGMLASRAEAAGHQVGDQDELVPGEDGDADDGTYYEDDIEYDDEYSEEDYGNYSREYADDGGDGSYYDQSDDPDDYSKYSGWGDDDDEIGDGNETGDEDDSGDDGMVYMFLQGNESSILSPFYISDTRDAPGNGTAGEAITDGVEDGEKSEGFPYLVDNGYVPRGETLIVLSEEQLLTLVGDSANETDSAEDSDVEATTEPYSTFFVEDHVWNATASPESPSADVINFHNRSEYITKEELDELLKMYEGFVVTGADEEWEANNATHGDKGVGKESDTIAETSLNADIEEKQSSEQDDEDDKTTPSANLAGELNQTKINYTDEDVAISQNNVTYNFSRIYEDLIQSNELSTEEKLNLTILERLRRTVESVGGEEAFRRNPKVHHIVKRQLVGNEVCGAFSRRRRDVGPASQRSRTNEKDERGSQLVRRRRGISNVGRRLEQGNVGYKQLYNQYKTMCTFIAMTVFEK